MQSEIDAKEAAQARQAYRGRIARLVGPANGGIDLRDALILIDCGAIHAKPPTTADEIDSLYQAIREEHGVRGLGPLLFYPNEDGEESVVRVRDILLDGRREIREASIEYLDKVIGVFGMSCRRTAETLKRLKAPVLESSESTWCRAAVELVDAIDDDWLLTVAGVRQSSHPNMGKGWSEYINTALRPTNAALNACAPTPLFPEVHKDSIDDHLRTWRSDGGSLEERCHVYLEVLGHLPFDKEHSLGSIISLNGANGATSTIAAELIRWAEQRNSPMARYHACDALLSATSQISDEQRNRLSAWFWEIILAPSVTPSPTAKHSVWSLTAQLARYFVHYLEVRLPTDHGEAVSAMAWWMSARLISSFTADSDDSQSFGEQLDRVYGSLASETWELVGPPMTPSVLRWLTAYGPSPWAISLLSAVESEEQARVLLDGAGPGTLAERVDALIAIAIQVANLPLEESRGIYRFSSGVHQVLGWIAAGETDETRRSLLKGWSDTIDWSPPDSLLKALDGIDKKHVSMQRWLCHGIRQRLFLGVLGGDELWEIVSTDEWKVSLWLLIDAISMQALGTGLIDDAARRRPDWRARLPHLFAEIAEERNSVDTDRVVLFGLLLRACFALHATSAMSRLLRGRAGHRYIALATAARGNLEQALPLVGGWAAGRIRAVLADLSY